MYGYKRTDSETGHECESLRILCIQVPVAPEDQKHQV